MSEGKKEGNGKRRKFAIVAQKIDGQMSPIWYWNGLMTKASGSRWDMVDMAITFEEKDKVIMDTVHALRNSTSRTWTKTPNKRKRRMRMSEPQIRQLKNV
jgi:hypothetical protein